MFFSRRIRRPLIFAALLLPSLTWAQKLPLNDYHEHLLSPSVARAIGQPKPFFAKDLIARMDSAGIRYAVVLSMAYQFGNPNRARMADEYQLVKAENDWTAT
jgi:hypothetical protein